MNTRLYTPAETFEFPPPFRQYEGSFGEIQSGSGGREGDQGRVAAMRACPPYQRGEVDRSRTQQGHLPSDVIQLDDRGLLIADFGVDWSTPKATLRRDAALRSWLNTILQVVRKNPSTVIRITGYSDCVGGEKNNTLLRSGRARGVRQLLQQLAGPQWQVLRPRIKFVGPAPAGDYVADNATIEGRAKNRGVLIYNLRDVFFKPDDVPARFKPEQPSPDTIERICSRGLELVQRLEHFGTKITPHQQKRIRCFLSRLCQAGFDDRYITGQGVLDYTNRVYDQPSYNSAKQWLLPAFVLKAGGKRPDEEIWRYLIQIDYDIIQGRHLINRFYATHGAATPIRVRELRDWVAKQESSDRTIYWCYGRNAP